MVRIIQRTVLRIKKKQNKKKTCLLKHYSGYFVGKSENISLIYSFGSIEKDIVKVDIEENFHIGIDEKIHM